MEPKSLDNKEELTDKREVNNNNNNNNKKKKRNDDDIISIQQALEDHIENQKHLIEEALHQEKGKWGEEDKCTFEKGYITQPVYACSTCNDRNGISKPHFGFCYGCSMQCHLYHDVYELFKKRSFRCDCGTKSSGYKRSIQNKEDSEPNKENEYNHNFSGKYCYCDSAYDYAEDMIQCIFCLDWYHERCVQLNSNLKIVPSQNEFIDFICQGCVQKHKEFFEDYPQIRFKTVEEKEIKNEDNNTTSDLKEIKKDNQEQVNIVKVEDNNNNITGNEICKKKLNGKVNEVIDIFCLDSWKEQLCKCKECENYYKSKKIEFIFEKDIYEEDEEEDEEELKAKESNNNNNNNTVDENVKNVFQKTEQLFEQMVPLTQQRVLVEGYSDMKEKLKDLFTQKQTSNQVITKQDIQTFFNQLLTKKKLKSNDNSMN